MLKAKNILGLLAIAISLSFLILCFTTFIVLPNDVLRKSSFHRTRGLPMMGQRAGSSSMRQKINSLLKSNNTAGRFAIRHVVDIDVNGERSPVTKKSMTSSSRVHANPQGEVPLLKVRPEVSKSDIGGVDKELLVKTLRDHGMHPVRARELASALLEKDKGH